MITYLSASELGLLASVVYFFLTAISYASKDIPQPVSWAFFLFTVVLLFISKNPYLVFVIDTSKARDVGFLLAIIGGVAVLAASWWHGHRYGSVDHSPQNEHDD